MRNRKICEAIKVTSGQSRVWLRVDLWEWGDREPALRSLLERLRFDLMCPAIAISEYKPYFLRRFVNSEDFLSSKSENFVPSGRIWEGWMDVSGLSRRFICSFDRIGPRLWSCLDLSLFTFQIGPLWFFKYFFFFFGNCKISHILICHLLYLNTITTKALFFLNCTTVYI